MSMFPRDVNGELLHAASMDNRAVDVAVDLEEAVAGLAMDVVRVGHLGALETEHELVQYVKKAHDRHMFRHITDAPRCVCHNMFIKRPYYNKPIDVCY